MSGFSAGGSSPAKNKPIARGMNRNHPDSLRWDHSCSASLFEYSLFCLSLAPESHVNYNSEVAVVFNLIRKEFYVTFSAFQSEQLYVVQPICRCVWNGWTPSQKILMNNWILWERWWLPAICCKFNRSIPMTSPCSLQTYTYICLIWKAADGI